MRGPAVPSWLVAGCAALVALALVGFVVTGERDAGVSAAPSGQGAATSGHHHQHQPSDRQTESEDAGQGEPRPNGRGEASPSVERTAYVEVYNNSGITGLADETSARLQAVGWQVVTTDNWYGEIPASTVYYPRHLREQARLLAGDLEVGRLHPAIAPMSGDRITVVLTGAP